jgi:hypothetical protein
MAAFVIAVPHLALEKEDSSEKPFITIGEELFSSSSAFRGQRAITASVIGDSTVNCVFEVIAGFLLTESGRC